MSASAILGLLVWLAKAVPAFDSILKQADAALAEHRRSQAHTAIDEDRARILAEPWRCPARCPHRLQHDGTQPTPAPALTP